MRLTANGLRYPNRCHKPIGHRHHGRLSKRGGTNQPTSTSSGTATQNRRTPLQKTDSLYSIIHTHSLTTKQLAITAILGFGGRPPIPSPRKPGFKIQDHLNIPQTPPFQQHFHSPLHPRRLQKPHTHTHPTMPSQSFIPAFVQHVPVAILAAGATGALLAGSALLAPALGILGFSSIGPVAGKSPPIPPGPRREDAIRVD